MNSVVKKIINCVKINIESLNKIGANNVKPEEYIIVYKLGDYSKLDVIYINGVKYKDNNL